LSEYLEAGRGRNERISSIDDLRTEVSAINDTVSGIKGGSGVVSSSNNSGVESSDSGLVSTESSGLVSAECSSVVSTGDNCSSGTRVARSTNGLLGVDANNASSGNVGLSGDNLAVDLNDLLFDHVDGLDDVLLMLNLDGHVIWDGHWALNDTWAVALDGVGAGNLNDLLNDFGLLHNLADGDVAGNGDLNDLLDNAFNRVWHVAGHDLFDRDGDADLVGLLNRVWGRDWALNNLGHLAHNWVWHGALNNFVHGVGNSDLLGNADLIGSINAFLNNSGDRVWDWHVNNLVNRVGFRALDNTGDGVRNLDFLADANLDRNVDTFLDNAGHWVGNRALDDFLDRVWDPGLNNFLNWVWNRAFHDLGHWVRNTDFLADGAVNRAWDLDRAVDNLLDRDGHVLVADLFNRVRNRDLSDLLDGHGNLHGTWDMDGAWDFHDLLHKAFNGEGNSLLNELLNRVGNALLYDLLNGAWDGLALNKGGGALHCNCGGADCSSLNNLATEIPSINDAIGGIKGGSG
jgi:hypothetical protein